MGRIIQETSLSSDILRFLSEKNGVVLFSEFPQLKNYSEENMRMTLWRLEKKNLIEKRGRAYVISPFGKKYVEERKKPDRWDGKWRILMFDIPESERNTRIWFRAQLVRLGYEAIQHSIFISKTPLPQFLLEEMGVRNILQYVRVMVVGTIHKNSLLSEKK